ncbi:hypothetical protein [Paenarthrobacter sp. CM16]|uniref:hypothetical protein n=1 Tax=Paenarthrobacter sp. CM16 TaxID=2738447 RepID=UPI001C12F5E7|nr:hypothetical protein [Paenarthrobacter sp. CM16]
MDRFFVGLQLAGNGVALVVAVLLPAFSTFQGLWGLAYLSGALLTGAFALYPMKLSAIGPAKVSTDGKRAVVPAAIRRTRWPYQSAFAGAYLALLIYAISIFGLYF